MQGMWGIVLALVLLMALAYRGYSVLLLAPLCALVAVLCSGDVPLLASYTQVFMPALGGFVVAFFPLFLLGAVFGKLIELSGFSRSIVAAAIQILGRRHAIPVIVVGSLLFQRRLEPLYDRVRASVADLSGVLAANLAGITTINLLCSDHGWFSAVRAICSAQRRTL